MTQVSATTARDLSAQREAAHDAIEDGTMATLANVLAGLGFGNEAAGAYAEVLACKLADMAIATLFDLHAVDAELRAA